MCRQGLAIVSPDFDNWLPECGESFFLPEPQDPSLRGPWKPYDQVHIGVGAASFGNVAVGLYCLWHNAPNPDDWFGHGTTSGDFGLLVSNDGLHFREPVKRHIWLHRDESPAMMSFGVPHARILCQGNGILNVGNETRIYHGRWVNAVDIRNYHAEVALATLPRDRWGAQGLFPDAESGSLWTAPITLPADAVLRANVDGVAGVAVEIADARFSPLPGFAGTVSEDGLDVPVCWNGASLAQLAGKTIRFRVTFTRLGSLDPRLYALYL
jgi:hypothetical protein